jgi:2-keto-4-pentenoate hydratase
MIMNRSNIKQTVETLGRARLADEAVPKLPDKWTPEGPDEGYQVQAALCAWFLSQGQGELSGYKVGATTKVMQDILAVREPAFGRIFSTNILASGVSLKPDAAVITGLETEIAFRLGADLAPSGSPVTRRDVMDCVEAVIPAIEIVENRFGNLLERGVGMLVADDFCHKACVLGTPVDFRPDFALEEVMGRIILDGRTLHTGSGSEVMGNPLEAVAWLANKLAEQDIMLKAGHIVMSGSLTPVHWIANYPCHAHVELDGIGAVEVSLG